LAKYPDDLDFRVSTAFLYLVLGQVAGEENDPAAAARWFTECVKTLQPLADAGRLPPKSRGAGVLADAKKTLHELPGATPAAPAADKPGE
jgi:hypothetical protein